LLAYYRNAALGAWAKVKLTFLSVRLWPNVVATDPKPRLVTI